MKVESVNIKIFLAVGMGLLAASCVPMQQAPPTAENFVFTPPTTTPLTNNNMSIAILLPESQGGFLQTHRADLSQTVSDFMAAAQTDLEKIIVAKGFAIAGTYQSFDDMTFSQKDGASLALIPQISLNIATDRGLFGTPSVATVSGSVVLQLLEPLSKEKVWIKRIELPPTTMNVSMAPLILQNGMMATDADGTPQFGLTRNSATALLNAFYASAFDKIWAHVDTREIALLKRDADKLKAKSTYRSN
jgi:hypothetical protein